MPGADTFSVSGTHTFTVADVGKVLDCFAADFDGVGQSTGLRARENTKAIAADVKQMAVRGFLAEVNLYLDNADGVTIRAAKYEVTTDAGVLTASRPGNYLWPRTPGGVLGVHVKYTQAWWNLTEAQRAAFRAGLSVQWGTLDLDTSFPMLRRQHDRNYVSNGFGLQKTVFV